MLNNGKLQWCGGVIERVRDGTWVKPSKSGRGKKYYDVREAAEVMWDVIEEIDAPRCKSIEPLDPRKWNKDNDGARRKDFGNFDYGL